MCSDVLHLFVVSSQQNSLRRGSSAWEPDDDLLLWVAVSPALLHQAKISHLPTGEDNKLVWIKLPWWEYIQLSVTCLVYPFTLRRAVFLLDCVCIAVLQSCSHCYNSQHINAINGWLLVVIVSYQLFKVLTVTSYVSGREGSEQWVPLVVLCSSNKQAAAEVCSHWVSVQTGAHQLSDCLRWERWLHSHSCRQRR